MPEGRIDWALTLYRRSVIKQEKLRQLITALGDTAHKTCLDLGGDNGVISLLLRQRGGTWWSADLDEKTVDSTRQLVGPDVVRLQNNRTPFPDHTFDVVVIVDLLEHLHDDRGFLDDLARVLKPGGRLVVNVPHVKRRSLLNRLRHAVGLTDEKHGHVRPGYDLESLKTLLDERFTLETSRTYSRAFSETVDIAVNLAYGLRSKSSAGAGSSKGTVVTRGDLEKRRKEFLLFSCVYPLLWVWSRLDVLLFLQPGYRLIVSATRRR
jgi:SAM-dependent methyltransferase